MTTSQDTAKALADLAALRRSYAADLAAQPARRDGWRYWAGIIARPSKPAMPAMHGDAQLAIRRIGRYGWEA